MYGDYSHVILLQVVFVKPSPAISTVTVQPITLPNLSSNSSWSSGDSDGGNPAISAAKRVKISAIQPQSSKGIIYQ